MSTNPVGWGEPPGGGGGGSGGGDWGEDDSGVLTAGWGKDSSIQPPNRGLGQWDAGSPDTWTTIPTKQKVSKDDPQIDLYLKCTAVHKWIGVV